ncbi:MAG: hypothetical protein K2K83_06665, partial [Rikenella sp.]|nr:hypothetical protein [Rikenella sp.]
RPREFHKDFAKCETFEIPLQAGGRRGFLSKQSLTARLRKSFPINSSFIGLISLLRRGAVPLGTRKLEFAQQQARTALKPGGLRVPAVGSGLPESRALRKNPTKTAGRAILRIA